MTFHLSSRFEKGAPAEQRKDARALCRDGLQQPARQLCPVSFDREHARGWSIRFGRERVAPLSAGGCEEASDLAPPSSNNPVPASGSGGCDTISRVQRPNIQTPLRAGARRLSTLARTALRVEVLFSFLARTPPTIRMPSELFDRCDALYQEIRASRAIARGGIFGSHGWSFRCCVRPLAMSDFVESPESPSGVVGFPVLRTLRLRRHICGEWDFLRVPFAEPPPQIYSSA